MKSLEDFLKATFLCPNTGEDMEPVSARGAEDGLDHLEIVLKDKSGINWKYEIKVSEV